MTVDELRALAREVGFAGISADIAAAVAMAESGGDPFAQGDPHGTPGPTPNGTSTSFGLWQVHAPVHPQYDAAQLLTNVRYCARAAFEISSGGTNWQPWTTFRDGSYRKFMPGGAT